MKIIYLLLLNLFPLVSYCQYQLILNVGDTVEIASYTEDNDYYSITKENGSSAKLSKTLVKSITRLKPEIISDSKFVYCEIVGTQKLFSLQVTVSVDYGQERGFFQDNRMRDESGKVQSFNSMVDALNYMGSMGWEFVQAYTVTSGQQNVYHWLLKGKK